MTFHAGLPHPALSQLPALLLFALPLFVIMFIYGWNQYLWPLLVTTSSDKYTIVAGIKRMADVAAEQGLVQVMRDMLSHPERFDWLYTRRDVRAVFFDGMARDELAALDRLTAR